MLGIQSNITDYQLIQEFYIATTNATYNSDELAFFFELDGLNDGIDNQQSVSFYILHIVILAFYAILILTSLISNPLLIYILLWKRKSQLKLIDVYVTNLSISDLFLTVFNIPLCLTMFFGGHWLFGTLMCKLGKF